jgi:hypothetical protein
LLEARVCQHQCYLSVLHVDAERGPHLHLVVPGTVRYGLLSRLWRENTGSRASLQELVNPAAWLLERLEPQTFGPPRLRVQLEAALSPAQLEALSDEELDALIGNRTGARAPARPRLLPPKEPA